MIKMVNYKVKVDHEITWLIEKLIYGKNIIKSLENEIIN